MDFQQRIQEASQYVDQTKASYDAAKQQTGIAQADYDAAFNNAPSYQTSYDKYKEQLTNSQEIVSMKTGWEAAKDNADALKSMMDKLPESINQQFGGSALTQAQRDKAKQYQLQDLSGQFTQYSANYEAQFADYSAAVDKAFDQALDVSNKEYDSYWDGVRRKYDTWQTQIASQEQWSKMYSASQDQLTTVKNQYVKWQGEQEIIKMQREFETWRTNFALSSSNSMAAAKKSAADYNEAAARKTAEANQRFATDTAAFQSGKLSSQEYLRRMDAGLYRT